MSNQELSDNVPDVQFKFMGSLRALMVVIASDGILTDPAVSDLVTRLIDVMSDAPVSEEQGVVYALLAAAYLSLIPPDIGVDAFAQLDAAEALRDMANWCDENEQVDA